MGEAAARSDEAVEKLQVGLSDLAAEVALLTTSQQQITAQLELAHRASTDHMRFADSVERRHDALAKQMQALQCAMERLAVSCTANRAEAGCGR